MLRMDTGLLSNYNYIKSLLRMDTGLLGKYNCIKSLIRTDAVLLSNYIKVVAKDGCWPFR